MGSQVAARGCQGRWPCFNDVVNHADITRDENRDLAVSFVADGYARIARIITNTRDLGDNAEQLIP